MRGRRPELKEIEGGLMKAPPPPSVLPKGMAEDWVAVAADLQGRGLLTTSMLGLLETYVTALWTVRECRKAIAKDGPIVRAKDGQPKPHPAGAMMSKAQDVIARLGAELGLTPSSRARKGLQGQGDDADDGAPAGLDL